MLTFEITSLDIKAIAKGPNTGQKYLDMTLIEDDPMAEKKHRQAVFVPQDRIPMWEAWKTDGKLPKVFGIYEEVKDLPVYQNIDSATKLPKGAEKTSMTVFVRCTKDGSPVESPRNVALRIIEQLCHKVVATSEA